MTNSLSDNEREALNLTAEVLVRIRSLARGQQNDASSTAEILKSIHDLADAVHNTPRLIADGVDLPKLLQREVNDAKALLLAKRA